MTKSRPYLFVILFNMKIITFTWLALGVFLLSIQLNTVLAEENSNNTNAPAVAISDSEPYVYMFGRDECGYCAAEKSYFEKEGIPFVYLNVAKDDKAAKLFNAITKKHDLSKVTPITVIGERVIVGFNGEKTTGKQIKEAIVLAMIGNIKTVEDHLAFAPKQSLSIEGTCSDIECDILAGSGFVFDLPFLGVVDLRTFSLITLSLILGLIDGINPCAMWVLITFLAILSQAGSRRKMIFLAGVFIIAEAVMYNLILNVWYKTWDFVALDQIVTPLVGFLALGGGAFFLYRWHKNHGLALVCDITSIDSQTKTINRFQKLVNEPITIMSIVAILVIAFSVNVIEFACSIGIPQAYTKILELNMLTFIERQWYILIYTISYMIDDFVVFALAIWGYSKLHAHGQKYAQYSLLVGGLLMLLLGAFLVLNPSALVI